QGRILLCDKLYRLHVNADVAPRFLIKVLRSYIARFQYEQESNGTSGSMQNIGQDTIKNLLHPLPPFTEQEQIAESLELTMRHDANVLTAQTEAIRLLTEYRSALVTAAVTGQIAE